MRRGSHLATNVKADDIRALKAMVTPLGGADVAPEPRYLDSWWSSVERAIRAVDTGCHVADLPRDAIEMLAPILLGQAGWELICKQPFADWLEFKEAVEDRFGIADEFQRDLFLQLTRSAGEDGCEFIRRVEDTRVRLGFSVGEALMKAWGNLPASITGHLESRHEMMGLGPIQWQHLVAYSKRQLAKRYSSGANSRLLPAAPAVAKSAPPPAPTRPPPRAPFTKPPQARAPLPKPPQKHANTSEFTRVDEHNAVSVPCWACEELGAFNPRSHTIEDCFSNP